MAARNTPAKATPKASTQTYTQQQVIAAITAAANQYGIPPEVLIATANQESGLNPNEHGGGLFQDIIGGEAENPIFKGNPNNVYNLQLSAENAAQTFAAAHAQNPNADWGTVAAIAQRPKLLLPNSSTPTNNPAQSGYAAAINSALGQPGSTNNPINATLTSDVTSTGGNVANTTTPAATTPAVNDTELSSLGASGVEPSTANGTAGSATAAGVGQQPTIAGANLKAFGATRANPAGYDLTGIPPNMLGDAEHAIQQYINDPGYASQINQKIAQDFGYSGGWIQKLPQVNAILIWASTSLDPSTAAGQNMFLGAISNTSWWKTTDQNQRAWQEAQAQDPASAANALQEAQDHVIATANQVGVKLSKTAITQIAETYAAQTYTPTNVLGSASGTSQEWLDQAVVDTALNIKSSGSVTGGKGTTTPNQDYSGGTAAISGSTDPSSLTGIAAQLYSQFQSIAQSYLLYDPDNPSSGALTQQNLMTDVGKALQNYTGSGSFGSSNLIQGAVNQFTQQSMTQAKQVYPSLSTAIDQGSTPQNYVAPLTNYVASQIGMTSGQINVMDPQWNWLIATPGANGVKGPVTQDQALQKITAVGPNGKNSFSWTNPSGQQMTYDNTNAAVQNTKAVTASLGQMFGIGGL